MKKKVLAMLLTAAMVATMAVGCGSKEEGSSDAAESAAPAAEASGDYSFEIIVKSFQSSYWQAAVLGIEQVADEMGVKVNCTGPNAESDIADQVNMLNSAIQNSPNGIGLAACDTEAVLDSLQAAKDAGIPVVLFDSGVPNAPEGSVVSLIATDNKAAGATAAENLYGALKDRIANADGQVRIGEVNQDATGESVQSRGLGFIEKFIELAGADGKKVAVIGNDYFVDGTEAEVVAEADADIIIEVAVPAQTTAELCATEAAKIMNKSDIIGIFGSNETAANGIITADGNLGILGSDPAADVLAAGFDAGTTIKEAVKSGQMFGAVTQSPLVMGQKTVETLVAVANGEEVSDIPTDGYWYNAENMEDPEIAPNLYD